MRSVTGNPMHTSVDTAVDNEGHLASPFSQPEPGLALPPFRGVSERIGGQVQPRPAAIDELVEVAGQALLEVVVFRAGADGPLDAGDAVHAERHGPHLPAVPLRTVVPALHRSHLARTGIPGYHLPVGPLPFRAPRVRADARVLAIG